MPRIGRSILVLSLLALGLPASASGQAYTVPADNPFVGAPGVAPEIYALGLRNPFRFSFDRQTGALTIGDVGQNAREEIDFVPAGGARGGNFEWACREGLVDGPKVGSCPPLANSIPPVFDYPNPPADPASITGGVVIRDPSMPSFVGRYVYADFFDQAVRSIVLAPGSASGDRDEGISVGDPVAFGEDAAGGVYIVSLGGIVYKFSESPPGTLAQTQFGGTFTAPMNIAAPPGDSSRVFVVERAGRVLVRRDGTTSTFLDIASLVGAGGEGGMSSAAFAPDYATSGRFYVFYSDTAGNIRVDEFRRSAVNPNDADEGTRRNVLTIDHSQDNHHYGGDMEFGPDGLLYISTGDGGGANDVFNHAQNRASLLGKLLRIDPRPPAGRAPATGVPAADTRPPRFRTKTKRRQRVLRLGGVVVYARCPAERCRVSMNARLRIGRLSYPLRRVRRTLQPNRRTRLRSRLRRRARRALRRALRDRTRARVDIGLRARDTAGNGTSLRHVTVRVLRRQRR